MLRRPRLSNRPRRGLGMSLVEVAASLAVAGVALSALMQISTDTNNSMRDTSAGNRLQEVQVAAQEYLKANGPALAAAVPVGGTPIVIPVGRTDSAGAIPTGPSGLPSLQGGGFLPSSFVDSNSYRQQHAMIVRQPTTGKLEVLVTTTGGLAVPDADLGRIASKVGAAGGVVLQNPPSYALGTIQGIGGGWSDTASTWNTGGVGPTPGHAVATLYFNASSGTSGMEYLNRFNTGVPEANRMHTNIDLNGMNLNGANTLDTQTIRNSTGGDLVLTNATQIYGTLKTTDNITTDGSVILNNGNGIVFKGGSGCLWYDDYRRSFCYDPGRDAFSTNELTGFHTNGNIDADTMYARIFADIGDPSYFVWPSGQTFLKQAKIDTLFTGDVWTYGNSRIEGDQRIVGGLTVTGHSYLNDGIDTDRPSTMADINMRVYNNLRWDGSGRGLTDNPTGGYLETLNNAPLWIHGWLHLDDALDVYGGAYFHEDVNIYEKTLYISRSPSGIAINTDGDIIASGVYSNGALSTGQNAAMGGACNVNGAIAKSGGTPLWCNGSTWRGIQLY